MADFDQDLGDRLRRLAAAVPVAEPRDPVELVRVVARPRPRLGWLAPVAAVLAVAALVGGSALLIAPGAGTGPDATTPAPNPTASPGAAIATDGPVAHRTTDGPFALELRSAKGVYRESEDIDVRGLLWYEGEDEVGMSGLKLAFSIDEPVYGMHIGDLNTMECNLGFARPGLVAEGQMRQSGGVSASDPLHDFRLAYLSDPAFTLPPGTWHVRYKATWFEGPCGPGVPQRHMASLIEIVVVPEDGAIVRLATAGEPVPEDSCGPTITGGILAPDPRTGLGLLANGRPLGVLWPAVFAAQRDGSRIALVTARGQAIARTGETVGLRGSEMTDGLFTSCGVASAPG